MGTTHGHAALEAAAIVVRRATDADATALSRLIGHTMLTVNVEDYPVGRLRELAEWFSSERVRELNRQRICLVAERGAAVLGTIGVEVPPAADGTATLVTFFVAPSAQGQGIGSRLLIDIEDQARAAGVRRLHLESSLAGAGFYLSHGFRATGERSTGHAGEHVVMTKELR